MTQFEQLSPKNRAEDIDAAAAAWLDKRDCGGWSEQDEEVFTAWLDADPIHRITYWRIETAWARTEKLAALRPTPAPRRRGLIFFRAAAAVIAVSAIAASAWFLAPRDTGVVYATSVGGRETVMLTDGSRIELNTDSAIRLADSTHARNIWLEKGEAYLQVTHDASRPLTVFIGNRRVTDLGTKFVVKRGADRLEVAVLEGRVSLDAHVAGSDAQPTMLRQGETAVASASGVSVLRKTTHELSNELGWRRGVIVFDNTPLGDAAEEVSRYNAVKVTVADAAVARLPVTGTVSSADPKEFLRMARVVFGLRAKIVDGKYVISH
jgi:transmembrane sensor